MKFHVKKIGKIKDKRIDQIIGEYEKKINRYAKFSFHHEKKINIPSNLSSQAKPIIILLDQRGKMTSSEEFAEMIASYQNNPATGEVWFCVGDAFGFPEEFIRAADSSISLSPMVFQNEIASLVLVEQIYRAFHILQGTAYHHP